MDNYTIRRVTLADAGQIADIYRYYVEETTVSFEEIPLTPDEMGDRISWISTDFPYFVAECEGEIIGYCYAHPWKVRPSYRRTLETTVYLRHDETSHGVGRALMQRLIEACRAESDYHVLIACITTENEGSRRFHASIGFREVSHFHEVGFKLGRYLDVTDMELIVS